MGIGAPIFQKGEWKIYENDPTAFVKTPEVKELCDKEARGLPGHHLKQPLKKWG